MERQSGFSLLELLVAAALLSILASLAVPQFNQLLRTSKLATSTNILLGSIIRARSEAIRRQQPVVIRHAGKGWERGWRVFVDFNNDTRWNPGEPLIQSQAALANGISARGNAPLKSYIRYMPLGFSRFNSGALQMGRIILCDETAQAQPGHARAVILSMGRPRTSRAEHELDSCRL